jgi:hypothetical protein
MIYRPSEAFRFLWRAYVVSLRQIHFGFWRRNNKKSCDQESRRDGLALIDEIAVSSGSAAGKLAADLVDQSGVANCDRDQA